MARRYYNGRRRRRTLKEVRTKDPGSVIWMILLFGLGYCCINGTYLFYKIHSNPLVMVSSPSLLPYPKDEAAEHNVEQKQKPPKHVPIVQPLDPKLLVGKERIIQIIREANMGESLTPEIVSQLPTWQQVVDRLGPKPKIYGLESCAAFQSTIPPEEAFVAPAGAFNSGTNLMAELLIANCFNPARRKKYKTNGVRWQVNWGKHQPPKYRLDQAVYEDKSVQMPNENILPVVTIRDPYMWFQSLCRNRYVRLCGKYSKRKGTKISSIFKIF
jgi:hypothetical protein